MKADIPGSADIVDSSVKKTSPKCDLEESLKFKTCSLRTVHVVGRQG
jgi:hypothetical protein